MNIYTWNTILRRATRVTDLSRCYWILCNENRFWREVSCNSWGVISRKLSQLFNHWLHRVEGYTIKFSSHCTDVWHVICKILEYVINRPLVEQNVAHNFIVEHLHSFLSEHSTTTNLLEATHDCCDWIVVFTNRSRVDVDCIDFSRAFASIILPSYLLSYTIAMA